jgi:hypothetical protein
MPTHAKHVRTVMKAQTLLFIVALLVIAAAVLVVGASILPAQPSPSDMGPASAGISPGAKPGNGSYVNSTYGYAVTLPEGWLYEESGESVSFLTPQGLEDVRVTTNPVSEALAGSEQAGTDREILQMLNASYIEQFETDIPGTEWVSTNETTLAGIPAYETVFSIPLTGEERYTFTIRYAVHTNAIYSVMYSEFPMAYDPNAGEVEQVADSFTFQ